MKKTAPTEVGGCMVEGGQEAILEILVETGYHSCLTVFPNHDDMISQSPNRNNSVRGCGFAT